MSTATDIASKFTPDLMGQRQDTRRIVVMQMSEIDPDPNQPRKHFDQAGLQDLAESIKRQGLIQPILVRRDQATGRYIIVAGERRWRAHQILERSTIEAIINTGSSREIALVENIQREDLRPMEEAEGLRKLIDEANYTQEEAGKVIGLSQSQVSRILRITELAEQIKAEVRAGVAATRDVLIEIATSSASEERQLELWAHYRAGTLASREDVREAKKRGRKAPVAPVSVYTRVARSLVGYAKAVEKAEGDPSEDERAEIKRAIRALNKALKAGEE